MAEPAAFVAVSVYVVVAAGLTLVDPLAAVEVNVPGVIATLVAPLVAQLSVLLLPAVMLVGLAVNALIVGLLAGFTVTVAVAVVDPAAFFAVSVYVVVAAGLTLVDPLAAAEVNVPGVIATFVAPLVAQLSVVLPPAVMLAGAALNEAIVGAVPVPDMECDEDPQPASPAQINAAKIGTQCAGAMKRSFRHAKRYLLYTWMKQTAGIESAELGEFIPPPLTTNDSILSHAEEEMLSK